MALERWQQVKELLQSALAQSPDERAAFLDRACAGDPSLRAEVESLIGYQKKAENFLEAPIEEVAAHILKDEVASLKDRSNIRSGVSREENINLSEDPTVPGGWLPSTPSNQSVRMFPVSNWDRYEFIELLGEGGMGRVYLAKDLRLKRKVALKFLSRDNAELNERFTKEAQTQAKIEHEHICKVYEVGEVEGYRYIAMQYIDGQTLKDAMKQMALEQKVKVMKQVAEALHAAHKNGLIHRDIKPTNIMVEESEEGVWRPSVMDFGLAKDVEIKGQTVTGAIMGTPAYMPPEQARGYISQLDRRSDVYSLGATLYEMLVGRPPFEGTSGMEIMFKVVGEEPVPIRKLNSSLPLDLETIVMKCLEKEPERRYSTAKLLAEDLGRYLDGEPIQARPTSWIYRATKKAKKHKAKVVVAAVAVVVIAVFTTAVYLYDSATLALAHEQQRRRAELLATLMSTEIIQYTTSNIVPLRNAVIQFKSTHKDVSEIHVYGSMATGLHEVLSYPESPRPLMPGLVNKLKQQSPYSEIDVKQKPLIIVHATAPIRSSHRLTGVVTIDLEFNERAGLAHDLSRLTWLLLGLTVLGITVLIYWLFRNIIW